MPWLAGQSGPPAPGVQAVADDIQAPLARSASSNSDRADMLRAIVAITLVCTLAGTHWASRDSYSPCYSGDRPGLKVHTSWDAYYVRREGEMRNAK